jgi:hypothetical protein
MFFVHFSSEWYRKSLCHFALPFDFFDFIADGPSILREVLGCRAPQRIDTYSVAPWAQGPKWDFVIDSIRPSICVVFISQK